MVGENIWLFIKKKREYKGRKVEKRGKRENLTELGGKNIILVIKGEGQKYHILGKYTPLKLGKPCSIIFVIFEG